jgi:hypothetical protein
MFAQPQASQLMFPSEDFTKQLDLQLINIAQLQLKFLKTSNDWVLCPVFIRFHLFTPFCSFQYRELTWECLRYLGQRRSWSSRFYVWTWKWLEFHQEQAGFNSCILNFFPIPNAWQINSPFVEIPQIRLQSLPVTQGVITL